MDPTTPCTLSALPYHGLMRAISLLRNGAPLEEVQHPDPEAGPDEIVVDIESAGICHSDGHYRADSSRLRLPRTLGHEIAGTVSSIGEAVTSVEPGQRVALHYLLSCGQCPFCLHDGERFCSQGQMLGKDVDGGFAERVVVPARNAIPIPDEVSSDEAAVMMCSTATAYHALRLASVQHGESIAILGFGGLGVSAVQLASTLDAGSLFAVDIVREKLQLAESFGALAIDAASGDLEEELLQATHGRGVDVILDFAGTARSTLKSIRSLAPGGRLMLVAINLRSLELDPYADVLGKERRIIGCSDHTRGELIELMSYARRGEIDLSRVITRKIPLEALAINAVLDELHLGTPHLRTVIEVS